MIVIDGSYGEGGGQILRYAAALAAVFGEKVKVVNIRIKRPNPGLRPQHIGGLKLLQTICGGRVEGLKVGSLEVAMDYGEPKPGNYIYNVGTAGSIMLVVQSILPALVKHGGDYELTIIGGTDVKWSPTADYFRYVFLPNLSVLGVYAEFKILKRGYYPRGGGRVRLSIHDSKVSNYTFQRSKILSTNVISIASNLPKHVSERQVKSFKYKLETLGVGNIKYNIDVLGPESAVDRGTSILIYSIMDNDVRNGGDAIGERGKPAESVGWEAYQRYLEWFESGAALDTFMGDMIIPYLFIAKGPSKYTTPRLTKHMESALYVAREITGREYRINTVNRYIEVAII